MNKKLATKKIIQEKGLQSPISLTERISSSLIFHSFHKFWATWTKKRSRNIKKRGEYGLVFFRCFWTKEVFFFSL